MRYSSRGGVRFPVRYAMNRQRIVTVTPQSVAIPLPRGAELLPEIKPGTKVLFGQPLTAYSAAFRTVFSSVSGVISSVDDHLLASGKHVPAVIIQNDGEDIPHESVRPCAKRLVDLKEEELIDFIERAGLVFPELAGGVLADSLRAALGRVSHLAISVMDTEPPVHVGAVLAANLPKEIIGGARILMKALGISRIVLCVGKKDTYGAARLKNAVNKSKRFSVLRISEKYPMDHPAILGRTVLKKMGARVKKNKPAPHCLVLGAEACVAVYRLFAFGEPMVRRILPIGGNCVSDPAVVSVPIGTSQAELMAACKVRKKPRLILNGGYLRGESVCAVDVPVETTHVSVVARSRSKKDQAPFAPVCIHCGRCISVCPAGLFPGELRGAVLRKDWKRAEEGLLRCIGCGLCSYVCPGKVDVVGDISRGFLDSAGAYAEEELQKMPAEEAAASSLAQRLSAYDGEGLLFEEDGAVSLQEKEMPEIAGENKAETYPEDEVSHQTFPETTEEEAVET